MTLSPGLYIIATPIGNLGDITVRAAETLKSVDHLYCEDKRVTRRLLDHLGFTRALRSYHDHNGAAVRPEILALLQDGQSVGLVSDAGTPLIADPGFKLVQAARAAALPVFTIPGPSALTAALSVAGTPTDRFSFLGFLPHKAKARGELLADALSRWETLIAYEAPSRLSATLAQLAETRPDLKLLVARELTKVFEEVRSGPVADLLEHFQDVPPKGEIVLIIPPQTDATPIEPARVEALMREAIAELGLSAAAKKVAAETGLSRRDLYAEWAKKKP